MKSVIIELRENMEVSATEDTQYILSFPDKQLLEPIEFILNMEREGVTAEIISLYKLQEGESVNLVTSSVHKVPNTECFTKIRGILDDNSSSNFVGKIIIKPNAQNTTAYLQDDILVTGNEVKNSSSPILEIEANDVKASHGATTGRVSEDQVYYLMTRGVDRNEAEELITKGFFESLLNTIIDSKIKEEVISNL
jgi:Fe-S cluster assembly protein SufD